MRRWHPQTAARMEAILVDCEAPVLPAAAAAAATDAFTAEDVAQMQHLSERPVVIADALHTTLPAEVDELERLVISALASAAEGVARAREGNTDYRMQLEQSSEPVAPGPPATEPDSPVLRRLAEALQEKPAEAARPRGGAPKSGARRTLLRAATKNPGQGARRALEKATGTRRVIRAPVRHRRWAARWGTAGSPVGAAPRPPVG